MRPLEGVVVETGTDLVVRLQSGAKLGIPHRRDLLLGDTCYILFDYTRLEVYDVWSEDEYHNLEDVSGPEDRSEKQPAWEICQQWLDESDSAPVVSL